MTRVRVVHEADLPWSVSQVWRVVTNVDQWRWRSDLEGCERVGEHDFVEYPKGGTPIRFTTVRREEERGREFTIDGESLKGSWQGVFTSTASGCLARFTEDVDVRGRFVPRWVARLFLRSYQARYFRDLRAELRRRYGEAGA